VFKPTNSVFAPSTHQHRKRLVKKRHTLISLHGYLKTQKISLIYFSYAQIHALQFVSQIEPQKANKNLEMREV
jgi:hypothetical protein